MWLLEWSKERRTFELSTQEFRIMRVCMAGALSWLASATEEFVCARLGASRTDALSLQSALDSLDAATPDSPEHAVVLAWTTAESKIAVRAIDELVNGFYEPEWEFGTLNGFERSEARELMHQLHLTLVSKAETLRKAKE